MHSNNRRVKQADDKEKGKDYREKNQEHKLSAMRWIGFVHI